MFQVQTIHPGETIQDVINQLPEIGTTHPKHGLRLVSVRCGPLPRRFREWLFRRECRWVITREYSNVKTTTVNEWGMSDYDLSGGE